MKRTRFLFLNLAISIALLLTFNNCDSFRKPVHTETNTGNPMRADIALRLSPVTSPSVSNLAFCPRVVTLVPANTNHAPVRVDLESGNVGLGNSSVSIGYVNIPFQSYDHLEITLSNGSGCQKSIQFTNNSGNFNSADSITVKYQGSFVVAEPTRTLELATQPIVDQLAGVSSNAQVKTTVESVSGQLNQIDAPAFRQLQEVSVVNSLASASIPDFVQPVLNGNLLICVIYFNSTANLVSGLSDSGGNNYNRVNRTTGGGGTLLNWTLEVWHAWNITGSSNFNVTANFTAPFNGEKDISCHEYSGIDTVAPMEINVYGSSGFGSDATTQQIPASQANELIFGVAAFETDGSSGAGFTQRSALRNLVTEDAIINQIGFYHSSFLNNPMNWIVQAQNFKGK